MANNLRTLGSSARRALMAVNQRKSRKEGPLSGRATPIKNAAFRNRKAAFLFFLLLAGAGSLFHRYRLGQVARLVGVGSAQYGNVIGQQLQWQGVVDRRQH